MAEVEIRRGGSGRPETVTYDIGRSIQKLRTERRFTPAEFEEALGVARGTVHHWESNRRAPKIDSILKILAALDVTFEALIDAKPNG